VDVKNASNGRVLYRLRGHSRAVSNIALSPGRRGQRIATASWDGTVKIWDAETGLELLTLRGHTNGVNCLAFSPDGDRLISGGIDATAILWDARPLRDAVPPTAPLAR
jgi:WD40 repeat protein